ncbi:MAG: TonB-dependent receptor, partial [Bacteroidetes bacterium]|nr:TonB-dependent receptor [Bacteroidota bacterium]
SYIDVLARPFLNNDLKGSQFYFYDLTAKVNYSHKRDNFYISGYFGDDAFSAANAFGVKWGNSTLTTRWNHVFSKKLFANFTYYYSRYRYNIEFKNRDASFNWKSYITNHSVKADFNHYITPKHVLSYGGQSTLYTFIPGSAVVKNKDVRTDFSLPNKYGLENAVYLGEDFNPSGKFSLRAGLRVSNWLYMGKGKAYYYDKASSPGSRRFVNHTKEFANGEVISSYTNPEPRLGFKYQLAKDKSIKGGYNRMVQNLHLISNTAASVPFDVWQPTSNNILPEKADQVTLGWFQNFGSNGDFETSFETYYKHLYNQVDYVDGANLLLNEYLEGDLLTGKGRAYGAEFYVRKVTGKLTGWISYTLSRSERKVNGVNDYKWYPTRFDRTHNLYVVSQYQLTQKWELAANLVISTGTPTTFYSGQYTVQGYIVPDAGSNARNNVRNPVYHRLDISATYYPKKRKHWESNWVFSVYNVYNRRNPFSIYFATDYQQKGSNAAIQYSVIGSFVPAVSYNFKWN